VLAACANSERLGALPVRSFHHADRPSTKVSKELAEFDATIDAAPLASIGHAAGVGTGRAAGATSAVKSSRKHRRAVTVEPVVAPVLVPAMAIEPARLVPSPRPGSIVPAVPMSASAVPMVQLRVQVQVPSGQAQDCWWSAPITWYSRQLRFLEVTAAWFAGDIFRELGPV
jgi:hypothetical protein